MPWREDGFHGWTKGTSAGPPNMGPVRGLAVPGFLSLVITDSAGRRLRGKTGHDETRAVEFSWLKKKECRIGGRPMKRDQIMGNRHRMRIAGDRVGFTLVEMLTVIVIIGILAALISAATIYARAQAREAAIYAQIKQMEAALMEYKNQYGEFPPDFWGLHSNDPNIQAQAQQELRRHLRKRWPRYAAGADPVTQFVTDLSALGMDATKFDAATALVFWLGGLPEEPPVSGGTYVPAGFFADEEHPFQFGRPRTGPLFEFDPKKIGYGDLDNDNSVDFVRYYPEGPAAPPVVYFRSKKDPATGRSGYAVNGVIAHFEHTVDDVAVAYLDGGTVSATPAWRNPDTFQIVHPGLDGMFGGPRTINDPTTWPVTITGARFTQGDYDNITNFAARLESEIE